MSKHRLSPILFPPAKRLHASKLRPSKQSPTFDNSIYDELVLCIFSHLSWVDLCAAQATSRNWARLAADNELWRKLYIKMFGRTRLRGARGFIARSDGREVKTLPGRAKADDYRDWKWMFRISSNWKRGRCMVEALHSLLPPLPTQDELWKSYHTHIILAGLHTVVASSQPAEIPVVQVTSNSTNRRIVLPCGTQLSGVSHITALALDQSPPASGSMRLASFLSSGEFIVFTFSHSQPSSSRRLDYVPSGRNSRTAPIIQAVYHHPLLVTLSQSFTLSLYDLSTQSIRLSQTLTSFTSFPPTSLVLSNPTPTSYKLVLAYAIPVYPAHWSVGVTELIIQGFRLPRISEVSGPVCSSNDEGSNTDPMTIIRTRTIRAIDLPQGWIDDRKLRTIREQWGRKVSQIADTQTDGKWVVLAPGNQVPYLAGYSTPQEVDSPPSTSSLTISADSSSNLSSTPTKTSYMYSPTCLQLYRLSIPPQSASVSAPSPRLTFVRTLHGQSGPVSALALADGRCVSLGHNGSIWVWDLEGGTGAEVAAADETAIGTSPVAVRGSVAFDERRIISALAANVVVRRFDI